MADGPNNKVIGSSKRFGRDVHAMMLRDTAHADQRLLRPDGYISRNDLAGLNLTTMPKVLIETGNMDNAADAALLVTPKVQRADRGGAGRGDRPVPGRALTGSPASANSGGA